MGRPTNRLTHLSVKNLEEPGRHADGNGLYLHIDPGGAKRWVFVFQWQGKRKEMGLGSTRAVKLSEAREAVAEARKRVAKGINPIDHRKAATGLLTFGEVADAYIADHSTNWRNAKHAAQWKMTLTHYAAPLRGVPVDAIKTEDVLGVLKPIWLEIPETASRTRGRIEMVLNAAKARKLRAGENPARWKDHLEHLLPRKRGLVRGHHPAMPFADLPDFMTELLGRDSASARALQLTILTCLRTSEVTGALWAEFDLAGAVWTIPEARMKRGPDHRVPLSPYVLKLIGQPIGDYVFLGARKKTPLSNMAMAELMKGMRPGLTVHGFRSTFRDWAGERTNFPREVIEGCLAHAISDRVEAAYRRGDALEKRRKVLLAWERYALSKVPKG